jgi:hypothetical protein
VPGRGGHEPSVRRTRAEHDGKTVFSCVKQGGAEAITVREEGRSLPRSTGFRIANRGWRWAATRSPGYRVSSSGCCDRVDDYEGISGHEEFRDDLRLPYFPSLAADTGALDALRMVPMQARKVRLCHASTAGSQWLQLVLERISRDFGTRVSRQPGGTLILLGPSQPPAPRGGW